MYIPNEVKRCNRILKDYRANPFGEPTFKWMLSTELFKWSQVGTENVPTGIVAPNGQHVLRAGVPKYEQRLQIPLTRTKGVPAWVLAKWLWTPRAEWERSLGSMPWPKSGRYFHVMLLLPGETPNTNLTYEIINALRKMERSEDKPEAAQREHDYETERDVADATKAWDRKLSDVVKDAVPAFANTPGSRDSNVSFGGIDEPTPPERVH